MKVDRQISALGEQTKTNARHAVEESIRFTQSGMDFQHNAENILVLYLPTACTGPVIIYELITVF